MVHVPHDPHARRAHLPRERLAASGAEALGDAELLALLLRTGHRGADALASAARLLVSRGGLQGVASSSPRELATVPGVGPVTVAALQACFELGRRIAGRQLRAGAPIRGPEDVYRHYHPSLRQAGQERFFAVLLDGRQRVLAHEIVSLGTLTASLVHPREVFRPALRACAASLILVHNHPSGDPTPSPEDRAVTLRLAQAGELLGVRVLDHVVVAERGFRSLREDGVLGG